MIVFIKCLNSSGTASNSVNPYLFGVSDRYIRKQKSSLWPLYQSLDVYSAFPNKIGVTLFRIPPFPVRVGVTAQSLPDCRVWRNRSSDGWSYFWSCGTEKEMNIFILDWSLNLKKKLRQHPDTLHSLLLMI